MTNSELSAMLDPDDRRRALSAVAEVFSESGYPNATWDQLRQASGLDPAVFAALFRDREDCFLTVYDSVISSARDAIIASLPPDSTWPVRLATGLRTTLELIDAHPEKARLVLIGAPGATADARAHHAQTIDRLQPFFAEGRRLAGAEVEPPSFIDTALPGGVVYMLGAQLKSAPERSISELYLETLRFLLTPYLGDEETDCFVAVAQAVESGPRSDCAPER